MQTHARLGMAPGPKLRVVPTQEHMSAPPRVPVRSVVTQQPYNGPHLIPPEYDALPPPRITPLYIPTPKGWTKVGTPRQPHIIPPENKLNYDVML
eukprot:7948110-Ditylum_brightwellii.AAC.2